MPWRRKKTSAELARAVATRRANLPARFAAKFVRGADDECWSWTGAKTSGYGRIQIANKWHRATHIALELIGTPVPAGMVACHRCDNPACVNPAHLFIGTPKDNTNDAIAKGRFVNPPLIRGERTNTAKLREVDIPLIRAAVAQGEHPRSVAIRFGVSRATIDGITKNRTWKHVLSEAA